MKSTYLRVPFLARLSWVHCLLALSLGGVTAKAQLVLPPGALATPPQIVAAASDLTKFTAELPFNQFDEAALGTLVGVEFEFTSTISGQVRIEHIGGLLPWVTSIQASRTLTTDLTATIPWDLTPVVLNHSHAVNVPLSAYDGITDFAGTSGYTDPPFFADSDPYFVEYGTGDPLLDVFKGVGTLSVFVDATATVTGSGGAFVSDTTRFVEAQLEVVYYYLPPAQPQTDIRGNVVCAGDQSPLEGFFVTLYNYLGQEIETVETFSDGEYLFTGVEFDPSIPESSLFTIEVTPYLGFDGFATTPNPVEIDVNETNVANFEFECEPVVCGPCDGRITLLTLQLVGVSEAQYIKVVGKHGVNFAVLFEGWVEPNGEFTIEGFDKQGTVGTEIRIFTGVASGKWLTIHTSCSVPIEVGMVFGNFQIVSGMSRNGGWLCGSTTPPPPPPVEPPPVEPPPSEPCGPCDGRITVLTLQLVGVVEAQNVKVVGKHGRDTKVLFEGVVEPNGQFTINGFDKQGSVGTEINITLNGSSVMIHTSCSVPIEVGMVFGNFQIVSGKSRNGGWLCGSVVPPPAPSIGTPTIIRPPAGKGRSIGKGR